MPHERFFYPTLLSKEAIVIEGDEFHHMVRVMRVKCEDRLQLVDGQGTLATAIVSKVEKREAVLTIEQMTKAPPPAFEVVLAQAIPRSLNRLDTIVEKGTELGMTKISLFPAELCERKTISEQQLKRIRLLTIAAMKQCGSLWLPKVEVAPALKEWKELLYPSYFGDLAEERLPFLTLLQKESPQKGALICIGPESGFSVAEKKFLQLLGAKGVKLHPHILRTDTAPLVALGLLTHFRLAFHLFP